MPIFWPDNGEDLGFFFTVNALPLFQLREGILISGKVFRRVEVFRDVTQIVGPDR